MENVRARERPRSTPSSAPARTVLNPGCGACIGCGPGVSETADQVTVSAINRNYKGRSGPGKLWLASPLTVAASAFTGRITAYTPGMFTRMASERPVLAVVARAQNRHRTERPTPGRGCCRCRCGRGSASSWLLAPRLSNGVEGVAQVEGELGEVDAEARGVDERVAAGEAGLDRAVGHRRLLLGDAAEEDEGVGDVPLHPEPQAGGVLPVARGGLGRVRGIEAGWASR